MSESIPYKGLKMFHYLAICITSLRILLTPLVVYFFIEKLWFQSLAVFLVAFLTDLLDGFVARTLKQESRFGQILDPIADKILLTSTMIALIYVFPTFFWASPGWTWWHQCFCCFLLIKEFVLLGVGFFLVRYKSFFIAPSRLSRVASIFEIISVIMMFLMIICGELGRNDAAYFWLLAYFIMTICLIVSVLLSGWLLMRYVSIIFKLIYKKK